MSLFRLEDVTFARGGAVVLDGATAEIRVGSTCVWGPSGAGKSSLLRLLNRLADPQQGRVLFHGDDVRTLDPLDLRRRVALLPQLPLPLPGTVADNVLYGARLARLRVDLPRVLELVALPRRFEQRDASRLSVGQQQRLMLARALALEPDVILLDEPTSALDEGARDAIEETLVRLREDAGVSLVVVTHDPLQARRLADRMIVLREGRVLSEGPAREVLTG